MATKEQKPPGLRWIRGTPYWVASLKGYQPRTVNLGYFKDDERKLADRCFRLHAEMLASLSDVGRDESYSGTFASLFRLYQTDADSSFQRVKAGTRETYAKYIRVLEGEFEAARVKDLTGLRITALFREWRKGPGKDQLPRARMMVAVLKAALSYGVAAGHTDCARLSAMLKAITFDVPRRREAIVTADMIDAVRQAAHEAGWPSVALASALQFETTARQWDVIGRWVPLTDPGVSDVVRGGEKWLGPRWEDITPDWVLSFTPSKTEKTSGAKVEADLSLCPMVWDELQKVPPDKRVGPLIVSEVTGVPYRWRSYNGTWRKVREQAGISSGIWSRDFRAGGVTEGRKAGASTDDLAKTAGHSTAKTTARVYDRDVLEAQRRAARARKKFRENR